MAISSAARSLSICVSRSNIRDWLIRRIIYFSPISRIRCRNGCRSLSCSYHGRHHAAIMQEAGADGMHTQISAGAKEEDIEPNTKPKPESRGLEGIPGYPHKESADHHPYNPPRKRYSPPLLLFYSLSQNFFLTKNSCSIITYTEVRDDK